MKKKFRDFIPAREFARVLGLKNQKEWQEYCKSGKKPDDIPAHPNSHYGNKWEGIGDWLGTNNISNRAKHKTFPPYDKASEISKNLGIKSGEDYFRYYKNNKIPENMPSSPPNTYHKIWNSSGGWGGFLGTNVVANRYREFLSYGDAQKYIQKIIFEGKKITSGREFRKWAKTKDRPSNIPASPERTYKKQGSWKGWGNFLGTGTIAPQNKKFRKFEKARAFARSKKLKNQQEWYAFTKTPKFPSDIPHAPHNEYRNSGWKGYGDFIGTEKIASQLIKYRPFLQARKFTRSLNLKNSKEWIEYTKSGKKPDDIPAAPWQTYKNKGWKSLGDWLGTFNQANRYAQYRSYSQARNFAIKLKLKSSSDWYRYSKSGKKPKDIPSSPIIVYRKEWKINGGWGGFLGTGIIASQEKSKNYLPFDEARKEARKLQKKYHLKTWTDWVKAYHERKIPKNIPLLPDRVYSKKRKKDGEKTV